MKCDCVESLPSMALIDNHHSGTSSIFLSANWSLDIGYISFYLVFCLVRSSWLKTYIFLLDSYNQRNVWCCHMFFCEWTLSGGSKNKGMTLFLQFWGFVLVFFWKWDWPTLSGIKNVGTAVWVPFYESEKMVCSDLLFTPYHRGWGKRGLP